MDTKLILFIISCNIKWTVMAGYGPPPPHLRCSSKLESALEQMFRKGQSRSGWKSEIDLTPPSSLFQHHHHHQQPSSPVSINEKIDYIDPVDNIDDPDDSGEHIRNHPPRSVQVAELRVRLPQNSRWVQVDKCQFLANNRTLDTRLVFPDLTISGRILVQPIGGQCEMILRLRRAGIEFRTVPIMMEGRSRTATVRTDSHFTEPGFISVFAHGCDRSLRKHRPNSKQTHFYGENGGIDRLKRKPYDGGGHGEAGGVGSGTIYRRYGTGTRNGDDMFGYNRRYDMLGDSMRRYDRGGGDIMSVDLTSIADDIRFDDQELDRFYGRIDDGEDNRMGERTYTQYLMHRLFDRRPTNDHQSSPMWQNVELANSAEQNDALNRELEELFSQGVRGLLTTYMQKALQPAIKETLMESMGYTLSYG